MAPNYLSVVHEIMLFKEIGRKVTDRYQKLEKNGDQVIIE